MNLTEIGFLRGTSQKHLAGIYMRQLLPVSFHAMLMQLLFCSAPSVIFRISFEFLLRSIEVLIFLIEFVFSALWSECFFCITCGGRISVGVKCFVSVWIFFFLQNFFYIIPQKFKVLVYWYCCLFPCPFTSTFLVVLASFWLPFNVFMWFTGYWRVHYKGVFWPKVSGAEH